jgi:hypothetical protein
MIDVGVCNQHARGETGLRMRGNQAALVIDGRRRPEAADQPEAAALLAHLR